MLRRFIPSLVVLCVATSPIGCQPAEDDESDAGAVADDDSGDDDEATADDDSADDDAPAEDDSADDDSADDDSADDDSGDDDEATADDDSAGEDAGMGDDDASDAGAGDDDVAQPDEDASDGTSADAGGGDGGSDPAASPDAGERADAVTIEDPAPEATDPGEYDCEGCPSSEVVDYQVVVDGESTFTFEGVVDGALGDGEFYVDGPDDQSIAGPISTDPSSGSYSLTVPLFCGTQLVKLVWSNDEGSYVLVVEVIREGCIDADIQATLTWDDLGLDYELHLIKEGGRINDPATDCTWDTCIPVGADWGVQGDPADDPVKDVDNTGNFGPENIYLSGPEPGTYTVMVEHWGSGSADSDGEVTLNVAGQTYTTPVTNLAPQNVVTIGTIEWPSGNVVFDGAVYDCTVEWSGGCNAELP